MGISIELLLKERSVSSITAYQVFEQQTTLPSHIREPTSTTTTKPTTTITKMLTTTLLTSALLTLTSALPTYPSNPPTSPPKASITLIDAVNHEWTITAPADQSVFLTGVKESISHVRLNNQGSVPCKFWGVDGVVIVSLPGDVKYMDVGPPQTIVGGVCGPWA
jgi:hypothetical protein